VDQELELRGLLHREVSGLAFSVIWRNFGR
jgi:hypothetical protein